VSSIPTGDTLYLDCAPELVDHTDDKPPPVESDQKTPLAYDWRMEAGSPIAPYGRPRHGDTYTRDGDTYHTVGGPPTMQPMDILTRWLEQLPGQLSGTNVNPAYDDYVRYSRPVVSPIPHHNRWEPAAAQYHAAMNISRDGVIRISTPTDTRDSRDCVIPYKADPRAEVYDGGGTRLLAYSPGPHDERPVRQFDINIERYKLKSIRVEAASTVEVYDGGGGYPPTASEVGAASEVYDGGGEYPPQDTPNSYEEQQATQSPHSVDNQQ